MLELKIEVTEKDIEQGIPTNHMLCPVARAMRRAVTDADLKFMVSVGVCTASVFIPGREGMVKVAALPTDVSNFILNFDNSGTRPAVKPFSATLLFKERYEHDPK